ncbi:MAG TPA: hypothetical protein VLH86_01200 [Patescibacteria group bacterium]|nr:hypothetical protein [Patescibacteria group bacterium]
MPEQLQTDELPPGSLEAYAATLDAMALELPEVKEGRDYLEQSGRELIETFGLEASFFENEGRARLLVGLAARQGRASIFTGDAQFIADAERKFVSDFVTVIGSEHSTKLADADEEITQQFYETNGRPTAEVQAAAYEKHTDKAKSRAVQDLIDERDLFGEQRAGMGLRAEDEQPYTVRVIDIRSSKPADVAALASFQRATGLIALSGLPAGWIVQGEERVMCLAEDVADDILRLQPGDSPILNDGVATLRHEKAHLERSWRLKGSSIGAGLNELGAEVLSRASPSRWAYVSLQRIKDHYNQIASDPYGFVSFIIPEKSPSEDLDAEPTDTDLDEINDTITLAGTAIPTAFLEEVFLSTPADADGFAHVITHIARQIGLQNMVMFAALIPEGGWNQLQDRFHNGLRKYVGDLNDQMFSMSPLPVEMRYPHYTAQYESAANNSVAGVIGELISAQAILATTREESMTDCVEQLDAAVEELRATLDGSTNPRSQDLLVHAATSFERLHAASLQIGRALLLFDDYLRMVA